MSVNCSPSKQKAKKIGNGSKSLEFSKADRDRRSKEESGRDVKTERSESEGRNQVQRPERFQDNIGTPGVIRRGTLVKDSDINPIEDMTESDLEDLDHQKTASQEDNEVSILENQTSNLAITLGIFL